MRYRLAQDVEIASSDQLLGPFTFAWPAGTHAPKSEHEEEAFRRLVAMGFAEEVSTKARKAAPKEA